MVGCLNSWSSAPSLNSSNKYFVNWRVSVTHSLNILSVQCDHHTNDTFCCTMCGPDTTNGHFLAVTMCDSRLCGCHTHFVHAVWLTRVVVSRNSQCCVTVTQPTDTFSLLRDSHTTNTYYCPCCDTQTTYILDVNWIATRLSGATRREHMVRYVSTRFGHFWWRTIARVLGPSTAVAVCQCLDVMRKSDCAELAAIIN